MKRSEDKGWFFPILEEARDIDGSGDRWETAFVREVLTIAFLGEEMVTSGVAAVMGIPESLQPVD
jgi:hypothetical protein